MPLGDCLLVALILVCREHRGRVWGYLLCSLHSRPPRVLAVPQAVVTDALWPPRAEPAGTEAAGRAERSCSAEGEPRSGASCSHSDARRATGDCPVLGSSHHGSPTCSSMVTGGKNPPSKVHTEVRGFRRLFRGLPSLLVDLVLPGTRLLPTLTRELSDADPAGLTTRAGPPGAGFPRRGVRWEAGAGPHAQMRSFCDL